MVFLCAGGMLDDDGKMIGSLLVMEFENREQLDGLTSTEQKPFSL